MVPDAPQNPWRYRCPNGHSAWRYRGDQYECKTCGAEFDRDDLVDMSRVANPAAQFADDE